MFVGEIGIPRHEFLFDIQFWEARRIIKGYNARHHHGWEQARLIAYQAHYCMGLPKGETAPTITEWLKFPWEKVTPPITNEEIESLQDEMDAINRTIQGQ